MNEKAQRPDEDKAIHHADDKTEPWRSKLLKPPTPAEIAELEQAGNLEQEIRDEINERADE